MSNQDPKDPTLQDVVCKTVQKKLDMALSVLDSLMRVGAMHPLKPDGTTHRNCGHFTLSGYTGNKSGFHEYIKSMDDYVKEFARLALEEIENIE